MLPQWTNEKQKSRLSGERAVSWSFQRAGYDLYNIIIADEKVLPTEGKKRKKLHDALKVWGKSGVSTKEE